MGKTARRIHGGVGLTRGGVVDKGRCRAQRLIGERRGLGNRILADGGQILLLMFLLVGLPVVPHLSERLPVHLLELSGEIGAAVGGAVVEADELVVAILGSQVVHETRSIEVSIGTYLEVHRGALGLETYHREQFFIFVDDASEVHLVVAAQSTSCAATHPRLHKTGNALMVPARHIPAGHSEVAP